MPHAPLVKYRRNLAGSAYPPIHSQLGGLASRQVRETLLQAARTRPSPEHSNAEATRLVEGMIARPHATKQPSQLARGTARLSS